ncbi:hypothetical protein PAEPH01_0397 [Pancytospora epiphaga]|nr:hypothetical protein PAEPH01_0397 [Pancytospora epiphaga]
MTLKLVTHSGNFHYDEILATALLEIIFEKVELIRTRDRNIIKTGDIVYDVGGIFNPDANHFDHHQNTFNETFSSKYTVKLSSCGLIYKYFCDRLFTKYSFYKENILYEEIKDKIYSEFFLYADAIDNGISLGATIPPRTLSDLVARFNVYNSSSEAELERKQQVQFRKALEIVKLDLTNYIEYIFTEYVPNYYEVYKEVIGVTGDIYITKLKAQPSLVFEVDEKLKKNIKYVIYTNRNEYRIVALPVKKGSFETRVPLLEKWRGLRDEELVSASGISDSIFVHATGFTGSAKTLSGAIRMCEKSLL